MRRLRNIPISRFIFLGLLLWLAIGFIVYPLFNTFGASVSDDEGLSSFTRFLIDPRNQTVILNTLRIGAASVLVCGFIGTILAFYMRFLCKRNRRLLQILLISPVMIPGVIIVIAFSQLYGESGMITKGIQLLFGLPEAPFVFEGFFGIVFVLAYTQYVFFYLNVYTALQYIDKSTVEAIRCMGGGSLRIIKDAIWPVIRPAVLLSCMTTFISAIGSYSAPALIGNGYRVLSTQIVMAKATYNMVLASIEVIVLLALGTAITVVFYRLSKRFSYRNSPHFERYEPDLSGKSWLRRLFSLFTLAQVVIVLLPVVMMVYLSFTSSSSIMTNIVPVDFTFANYGEIFKNSRTLQPMVNSVAMSAFAVLVGLAFVVPTVYMGSRRPTWVTRVAEGLLMLPWSMSGSVIAINLINVFNNPTVFALGSSLVGTYIILPIAYTIVALPLLLNATRAALGTLNADSEEAARSLGANAIRSFADVVMPVISTGIISGAILVFVRTMGEYTMSQLLYGVHNRPISVTIVTNMQEYNLGTAFAYGTLTIALCFVLLLIVLSLDSGRFSLDKREPSL